MHISSQDVFYAILAPAALKAAIELAKRIFVTSEEDAIKWLHYKYRAMRKGHSLKHPRECEEGHCSRV